MNKKDYYGILGLTPSCSPQDIKKNYYKLALIWHPDKHTNKSEAQTKFTEINEAYSILADPKKRQLYDTYGHQGLSSNFEAQASAGSHKKNFFHEKGFGGTNKSAFDILRDIFTENNDDDFFHMHNPFNMSDTFHRAFSSFMHDFRGNDNDHSDNFFQSYVPTFMDSSFFSPPPFLQSFFSNEPEPESQFFSFFSSSMDAGVQSFSKTSTTFINNGKVQTTTKQRIQKGDTVIEDEQNHEYNRPGPSLESRNTQNPKPLPKSNAEKKKSDVILIEDDDESPVNSKNNPKRTKKQKEMKNPRQSAPEELKNSYRMFDFGSLSDEDNDNLDIFGENGMNFKKRCSQKNKI